MQRELNRQRWACDVEPYAWLRHVLTELPKRSPGVNVTDLLPLNYAKS